MNKSFTIDMLKSTYWLRVTDADRATLKSIRLTDAAAAARTAPVGGRRSAGMMKRAEHPL